MKIYQNIKNPSIYRILALAWYLQEYVGIRY